jgi:hypothetical protein
MFSFREACRRQMVHALIVGSKHGLETDVRSAGSGMH